MTVITQYGNYYNVNTIEKMDEECLILYFSDGDTQAVWLIDVIKIEEPSD